MILWVPFEEIIIKVDLVCSIITLFFFITTSVNPNHVIIIPNRSTILARGYLHPWIIHYILLWFLYMVFIIIEVPQWNFKWHPHLWVAFCLHLGWIPYHTTVFTFFQILGVKSPCVNYLLIIWEQNRKVGVEVLRWANNHIFWQIRYQKRYVCSIISLVVKTTVYPYLFYTYWPSYIIWLLLTKEHHFRRVLTLTTFTVILPTHAMSCSQYENSPQLVNNVLIVGVAQACRTDMSHSIKIG